jgi:hypothetical protein
MSKLETIKAVGSLIVSVGVGSIVSNAVKCTTPGPVGTIKAVCIGVGSFVLANMVGDQAVKYTEEKIDGAVSEVKKMVENGDLN